jgi:CDP-glucose 4,6-dehydratase
VSAISDTFWSGRRVLVTGHSGFKGRWLSLWLRSLGAEVVGFSRRVAEDPEVESIQGDVADFGAVLAAVEAARPQVVFHMAGFSTVRIGIEDPVATYTANVIGTTNLLEAIRRTGHPRAVVSVTTDKVYLDQGSEWGYREDDRLGGSDPYSSSKVCQELVIGAFRDSLLADRGIAVASARAGNVIGGGDRTDGRLVPDLIRACLEGTTLEVRAPDAIRPWQHVLNPLYGYLLLAQKLWDDPSAATAWNFGPDQEASRPVGWLVARLCARWPGASTGFRRGTCPPRSTPPSTGTSPTGRAATSLSSRSSASPPRPRASRPTRLRSEGAAGLVRSPENEAVVLSMWAAYDRDGLPGILEWAAEDAEWRPHSAEQSVFHSTADYRSYMEEAAARGVHVDSVRLGIWSHGDVVAVRGRLRVRQGGAIDDSRMYWVHRVRDGKVQWTGSSPDLGRLLADVGLPGRGITNEAFMAMHEGPRLP